LTLVVEFYLHCYKVCPAFYSFVTLLSHTVFNIRSAMSDLRKSMDSFSIIPGALDLTTVTLS